MKSKSSMLIRKKDVIEKLHDYLNHKLELAELVDWAEVALMEGELENSSFEKMRDTLARLGLADVSTFGLAWEECEKILEQLGYRANVEITEIN